MRLLMTPLKMKFKYAAAAVFLAITAVLLFVLIPEQRAQANNAAHALCEAGAFTQNWSNLGLITADDDWSGVASIIGYRGDGLTSSEGVDPRTVLSPGLDVIDVNANVTLSPAGFGNSGVAEFHSAGTVALKGSATADAPFLLISLDTTDTTNVHIAYIVADIDSSSSGVEEPFALHYRVGSSGNFINIPGGYVPDAANQTNPPPRVVNTDLPAAVLDHPLVQLRILTTNAVNNDQWAAVDNLNITATCSTNTPPTTSGIANVTVDEDAPNTAINLFPSFADAQDDDNELIYSVQANTNSTLFSSVGIVGGQLTLDYAPNRFGDALVTIRATDTGGQSVDTSFTVTVNTINDPPTTSGIANVTVIEDAPDTLINLFPSFADTEDADSALTYALVGNSNNGLFTSTSIASGQLTLNYAPNMNGQAILSVRATDTGGLSVETNFTVTIGGTNDAPTTSGIPDVTVDEDAPDTVINLFNRFADAEDDDDALIYTIEDTTNEALFTDVTLDDGQLTLDYAPNLNGQATFTIQAMDTTGLFVQAIFDVTVNPVNDDPIANDDSASTLFNTPVTIDVLANDGDVEGSGLFVSLDTSPAVGSADVNSDGSITFTPGSNFSGSMTFVYSLSDGDEGVDTATVTVTVGEQPSCDERNLRLDLSGTIDGSGATGHVTNNGPLACDYQIGLAAYRKFDNVIENQELFDSVNRIVNIEPGQTVDLSVAVPGCAAQVDLFYGPTLKSLRGQRYGSRLLSAVHINGQNFCSNNQPPVAANDGASTHQGVAVDIGVLGNDSDPNGNALSIVGNTSPANGGLALNGGTFTYTPNAGFVGGDSFTYTISDGEFTATASVTIDVTNQPPFGLPDTASTATNSPLSIPAGALTGNDGDPDGDVVAIIGASNGANGLATLNGSTVNYVPNEDFNGVDSFTYTLSDGVATVNVSVTVTVGTPPESIP